jgi:uncharacterized protein YjiS (DUF1127 family)
LRSWSSIFFIGFRAADCIPIGDRIRAVEEAYWAATLILALLVGFEEWYQRRRFRNRLKDILREHLSDPRWTWRSFEAMERAIKADFQTTEQLLFEIGATPSAKDKERPLGKKDSTPNKQKGRNLAAPARFSDFGEELAPISLSTSN